MLSFATPRIVNDGNNDRGGSSPFSVLDLRLPTTEQNNGIKLEYLKIWSYKIGGGKGRRKARRITSLLSSLFCSASTALGEGGKIFYRWTRNLPTSLSYFRHEINISPPGCIWVDAPLVKPGSWQCSRWKIRGHASMKRTKSTTREEYMEGERVQEGTISVNLPTRALILLFLVLCSLTTCVSRRVKTCHARFAARKASFGSKKVAGFWNLDAGLLGSFSTRS